MRLPRPSLPPPSSSQPTQLRLSLASRRTLPQRVVLNNYTIEAGWFARPTRTNKGIEQITGQHRFPPHTEASAFLRLLYFSFCKPSETGRSLLLILELKVRVKYLIDFVAVAEQGSESSCVIRGLQLSVVELDHPCSAVMSHQVAKSTSLNDGIGQL